MIYLFTPCSLIIRKTFGYSIVLFALFLVDSFSLTFLERHSRGGSCINQNMVLQKEFEISMEKLRLGYMIMWVQELTMMLQANFAQQWLTVLVGQGYSHVGLVKKGNHALLSRMKVRGLSSLYIMAFGSGLWGLCNLIQ